MTASLEDLNQSIVGLSNAGNHGGGGGAGAGAGRSLKSPSEDMSALVSMAMAGTTATIPTSTTTTTTTIPPLRPRETTESQISLARSLSAFSFRRKSQSSVKGDGTVPLLFGAGMGMGGGGGAASNAGSYRKASTASSRSIASISGSPASMGTGVNVISGPILMNGVELIHNGAKQLPTISQSPRVEGESAAVFAITGGSSPRQMGIQPSPSPSTQFDDGNSTPNSSISKSHRRKFSLPKHIVIPSRNQSLPATPDSAMLANVKSGGEGPQMAHPYFKYPDLGPADSRISIFSNGTLGTAEEMEQEREEERMQVEMQRKQENGQGQDQEEGVLGGLNIRLGDVEETDHERMMMAEPPRKDSIKTTHTFDSSFSLTRKGGPSSDEGYNSAAARSVSKRNQINLDDGSDTERENDVNRAVPPTPTLIADSSSSGEDRRNDLMTREASHETRDTSIRRNFLSQSKWLANAGRSDSGLTIGPPIPPKMVPLNDGTPRASQVGFHSGSDVSITGRTKARPQSWQALRDIEAREEQEQQRDSNPKKKGRKSRSKPSMDRTDSDEVAGQSSGLREAMRARREKKKAEKQRFIDECEIPPSANDLFDVSMLNVLDSEGKTVRFGDIVKGGGGRKTVVVFIRHCELMQCQRYEKYPRLILRCISIQGTAHFVESTLRTSSVP